ncbi:MAG: PAS domain-containing protein [Candidatus Tokpelaia sp.]|nr:MAG: PAS domain-containing protein [Candidatus Tokpelaia sp.]KAA6205994.1 MAG: PAS domain-containing protein [Candidatus Tokpelaia sp.]
MASPLQATGSPPGSSMLFPDKAAKARICSRLVRLFCAFAAFTGLGLAAKTLLPAAGSAGMVSVVLADNNFPAFACFAGLTAALAAAATILLRRNKILAGKVKILRQRSEHYQDNIVASAQKNRADNAAATAGQADYGLPAALDKIIFPLWLRDKEGVIRFANQACQAISQGQIAAEQPGATMTKTEQHALPDIETLFSPALRQALAEARQQKRDYSGKTNIILQGNRHIFACHSLYEAQSQSFLGIAEDITEKLHLRDEAKRIKQGYAETFDRLSTSVAIFDPAQKLEFFNSAFAALWPLENRFLESRPSHTLLLDRLREKGILNERPDWRQWKEDLFEAYRSLNPQHYIWNLPDGRTLRVVANPHPQGGVTWLFDDLTEKLALQARYNTLIRMQGEVLDNLSEGVAVFGSDGRLRLANPAFAGLWHLPANLAIEGTHIEKIKSFCRQQQEARSAERATGTRGQEAGRGADRRACGTTGAEREKAGSAEGEQGNTAKSAINAAKMPEQEQATANSGEDNTSNAVWQKLALYVTGFADKRDFVQGRTEVHYADTAGRRIFDYMSVPLPQGQTMLTFVDVTDSVNIARALHERNNALESADKLRNDFVQHVSYELRTPLTNIMGFTDLLLSSAFGGLTRQQSDYLQHIAGQSVLLFNLVNDILDLATVDAGIMELNIGAVSVAKVMDYAAERVKAGLEAKNIILDKYIAAGLTQFEADEARLRQIFVNLLDNAVQAAPENSHICFTAEKYKNYIAFSVTDEGPGIPPERLETIFKRFTSYAYEGRKTGIGLGLSIVKSFVELHQGHVQAENGKDKGTRLICRFPFHDNTLKQG